MVLAQRQKYRPITGQRAQRETHTPMGTLFLTNEVRIYNGAKIASSKNGGGKMGQLHVKE